MSHIIICIKNRDDKMEEILPGYAKLETNYEPENTMCWNCCHICDSVKYLPLKYKDSIFYVNGFFCSDECSFRYIYDTYKDKELWSKYQLMKFYLPFIKLFKCKFVTLIVGFFNIISVSSHESCGKKNNFMTIFM